MKNNNKNKATNCNSKVDSKVKNCKQTEEKSKKSSDMKSGMDNSDY